MRGAVAVTALVEDFTITSGRDVLCLYKFNTMTAEHFFCSICGIYTHHKRRSNPNQLGVNVACLDGVSPFDFECVPVNEGIVHPRDRPSSPDDGVAGYLRYEKASRQA
jgi:hypothetical protein